MRKSPADLVTIRVYSLFMGQQTRIHELKLDYDSNKPSNSDQAMIVVNDFTYDYNFNKSPLMDPLTILLTPNGKYVKYTLPQHVNETVLLSFINRFALKNELYIMQRGVGESLTLQYDYIRN